MNHLQRLLEERAKELLASKSWRGMTLREHKICLRHLVAQAESQKELETLLQSFGIDRYVIDWQSADTNNREDLAILKQIGRLVSKSGASVLIVAM